MGLKRKINTKMWNKDTTMNTRASKDSTINIRPGFGAPFLCSICQQPGHKAEMCPNGQVDWIARLGNRAFRLRPPLYWSEDPTNPKNRRTAIPHLEKIERSARNYVIESCRKKEMGFEDMMKMGRVKHETTYEEFENESKNTRKSQERVTCISLKSCMYPESPSKPSKDENQLPQNWTSIYDSQGRLYYWNKTKGTTQWNRP